MKIFEYPEMNIKKFSREIATEASGTNTADAVTSVENKANGGYTKVSFDELKFTL